MGGRSSLIGGFVCAVLAASLAACNSSATPTHAFSPGPTGFHATGSMSVARLSHVAVRLNDGHVLIAGGYKSATQTLASAELYDPGSGHFTATGSMTVERAGATATLLPDGHVLIAGGYRFDQGHATIPLASAELYDPGSGTFAATGSMATARYNHTATLLGDGRILVTGGMGPHVTLDTAEIYAGGSFTAAGSMTTPRAGHVAALLPDGRVMVAGGLTASEPGNPTYLASAELFDPSGGTFVATGSMAVQRYSPTCALLSGGRVVVIGGLRFQDATHKYSLGTAEVFDSGAGTFSAAGSMSSPRLGPGTVVLSDGRVLVAGGQLVNGGTATYLATAEVYQPNGTFLSAGSMSTARYGPTATLLQDGRVLLAGGGGSDAPIATAELFQP